MDCLIPVHFRGGAGDTLEQPCKIIDIRDAALLCNGFDGEVRAQQQLLGVLHTAFIHIIGQRHPYFLFKQRGKVTGIYVELFRKYIEP